MTGKRRPMPAHQQEALNTVRDCTDAILAAMRNDEAGLSRVILRIKNPQGAVALMAYLASGVICRAAGHPDLVREDPEAVLREVAGTAVDGLLDVPESHLDAETAMRKVTGIAESGQP